MEQNQDTISLLRECDAGVKMGIASIDEVLEYVHSDTLRGLLSDCKAPARAPETSDAEAAGPGGL